MFLCNAIENRSRLALDSRCPQFPVYQDVWKSAAALKLYKNYQPYAYFSSGGYLNRYGNDCYLIGANAYYDGLANGYPNYLNSNGYQIITAGEDGIFGYDKKPNPSGGALWIPNAGFTAVSGLELDPSSLKPKNIFAGADDQSNFAIGLLGAGQQ
jgi:hypothetical protein